MQVSNRIARDVREIAQLDAEAASPFASANDVLVRLLPYHVRAEPSAKSVEQHMSGIVLGRFHAYDLLLSCRGELATFNVTPRGH